MSELEENGALDRVINSQAAEMWWNLFPLRAGKVKLHLVESFSEGSLKETPLCPTLRMPMRGSLQLFYCGTGKLHSTRIWFYYLNTTNRKTNIHSFSPYNSIYLFLSLTHTPTSPPYENNYMACSHE